MPVCSPNTCKGVFNSNVTAFRLSPIVLRVYTLVLFILLRMFREGGLDVYMLYVKRICTSIVYIQCIHWWVHSMCTYGVYIQCVHMVCTFDVYIWCVHSMCTYGEYIQCIHMVSTFNVYIEFVNVLHV